MVTVNTEWKAVTLHGKHSIRTAYLNTLFPLSLTRYHSGQHAVDEICSSEMMTGMLSHQCQCHTTTDLGEWGQCSLSGPGLWRNVSCSVRDQYSCTMHILVEVTEKNGSCNHHLLYINIHRYISWKIAAPIIQVFVYHVLATGSDRKNGSYNHHLLWINIHRYI